MGIMMLTLISLFLTIIVLALAWSFGITLNPFITFIVVALLVILIALRS